MPCRDEEVADQDFAEVGTFKGHDLGFLATVIAEHGGMTIKQIVECGAGEKDDVHRMAVYMSQILEHIKMVGDMHSREITFRLFNHRAVHCGERMLRFRTRSCCTWEGGLEEGLLHDDLWR